VLTSMTSPVTRSSSWSGGVSPRRPGWVNSWGSGGDSPAPRARMSLRSQWP
jgi:hypothetical protein